MYHNRKKLVKKSLDAADRKVWRQSVLLPREAKMKTQEAISILMLSPGYWRMRLPERKELIREFMANYAGIEYSLAPMPAKKRTGQ